MKDGKPVPSRLVFRVIVVANIGYSYDMYAAHTLCTKSDILAIDGFYLRRNSGGHNHSVNTVGGNAQYATVSLELLSLAAAHTHLVPCPNNPSEENFFSNDIRNYCRQPFSVYSYNIKITVFELSQYFV